MGFNRVDFLVLSSDDQKIIETARKLGSEVPFTRPISESAYIDIGQLTEYKKNINLLFDG